jgi:hypothetical protein
MNHAEPSSSPSLPIVKVSVVGSAIILIVLPAGHAPTLVIAVNDECSQD